MTRDGIRRHCLGASAARVALASALAASAGCQHAAEPPKPDVVVLVIDALRADRLAFYGYGKPTSPRLDELARSSVWFRQAFAQATWTKPSIGSLLTSRYPSELGLLDLDFQRDARKTNVLTAGVPLLTERFSSSGWRTGAVINQVHLSRRTGFARGFDDFRHFRGRDGFDLARSFGEFLSQLGERRFFAYVHFLDPHWPYSELPNEDLAAFGRLARSIRVPKDLAAFERWRERNLTPEIVQALSNRYDAGVRYTDGAAGRLVDQLRDAGRWENTILVVTADHGEGFGEHDELMHGFEPYVEVARVPLLVHLPARFAVAPGERLAPVGLIDVAPTLLDLAGAMAIPDARGRSLRHLLAGDEPADRPVLTQSIQAWALRDARFSLVALPGSRLEFYDRWQDPEERRLLDPAGCGEPCARLARRLRELRAAYGSPVAQRDTTELTAEQIEELRALGYL